MSAGITTVTVLDGLGIQRTFVVQSTTGDATGELQFVQQLTGVDGVNPATGDNPVPVAGIVTVDNGSTGDDFSSNNPAFPTIGGNFSGAAGAYASFVLIATVPASPTRASVEVLNTAKDRIAVMRDDGTATTGQVPVNPSVFGLANSPAFGCIGDRWRSETFKGRIQVFAIDPTAHVAILVD